MTAPSRFPRDRALHGNHCQCMGCGEYFNSTYAFDQHCYGRGNHQPPNYGRHCLTPAEMTARGWIRNAGGYWITAVRAKFAATSSVGAAIESEAVHG